jgi:hypothetical protein
MLTDCRVVCDRALIDDEPYQVFFSAQGREFACPLYAFQPRTECRLADSVEDPGRGDENLAHSLSCGERIQSRTAR